MIMAKLDSETTRLLKKIYYDVSDPGSFGGIARLHKRALEKGLKIKRHQIIEFLKNEDAYTLHRPARKHYSRNKTIVGGIDRQWQADLADMSDIAKHNDGYRYLLTVIDCFSKYAWAIPLKKKDSQTVLEGFQSLFKISAPRIPKKLHTDKGKEFLNKEVQDYFKTKNIFHFVTNSDTKAAIVERFNRTLKTRMYAYFSGNNTYRYLDILTDLLKNYNASYHRTIGMKPIDVKENHSNKIWNRMYGSLSSFTGKQHKKDSTVRISKVKGIFEKGYLPSWSEEIFKISDSLNRTKPVYKLKDYQDEEIAGTFYPEEIQPITKDPNATFHIEKVIQKRKSKGIKEALVKWKGWPQKFNSWIKEVDLIKLK